MSSYAYRDRERDRDWDDPRSVSVKRYVVPSEDDYHRRDYPVERELVIRRSNDRDDYPSMAHRYERDLDYEPRRYDRDYRSERDYYEREYCRPYALGPHSLPDAFVIRQGHPVIIHEARGIVYGHRDSDYEIVHRSAFDRDSGHSSQRRHRHHDDDRIARREVSPGDSVSQMSRRRDDQGYSSDESVTYVRKETRDYDDHPHHRRNLAGGALAGVGAAELIRSRSKKEGDEVSHGWGRVGRDVGAGALGAVAVNVAERARDYYRSKSRHRSHSVDDDRSSHHYRHSHGRRSRSRSRSGSHHRIKTFAELGLGAAAIAGAVALARNKSNSGRSRSRHSRSRHRRASSAGAGDDRGRSQSQRRKHMVGAGLAGAAAAGLLERARSHSRPGKSRSRSKIRTALPIAAAGLGTAAATGLWEKHKENKEEEGSARRSRHRSRSRSQPRSDIYPDQTRDSAGLIEYGDHPVHGNIPEDHYYGRPASQQGYYSDATDPVASGAAYGSSRHRSRSRGARHSSSSADSDRRRRHRRRRDKRRSRSRDHGGPGYSDDDVHHDPYEESYYPEPYPAAAPPPAQQMGSNSSYFFPPPNNQTDYPPPPGAPPAHPYGYSSAPAPGPETYAPRPRRGDENVSAVPTPIDEGHSHDGGSGSDANVLENNADPVRAGLRSRSRRSTSLSAHEPSKSVSFNVSRDRDRDAGYESDESDSTISLGDSRRHSHPQQRRSSPPRPSKPTNNSSPRDTLKRQESDSDSTIDLPDRFDAQGRLLPQRENEVDPLEALIRGLKREFA